MSFVKKKSYYEILCTEENNEQNLKRFVFGGRKMRFNPNRDVYVSCERKVQCQGP
jgi:hypothetical protein